MKKILFNDKFSLTQAVLEGRKTMTRRIVTEKQLYYIRRHFRGLAVMEAPFKYDEVVAVAQNYKDVMESRGESGVSHLVAKAGYKNKMFVKAGLMPHQIRITNIRVERLQDISDEDCIREGIYKDNPRPGFYFNGYAFELSKDQNGNILAARWYKTPRDAFAALIDKVSGKGTWERNPWVFVYEFKLVK